LAFNRNRDPTDPRLIGPFDNPGTTAGYFALATVICLVELMYSKGGRRRLVVTLILTNVACILATANRASFLVLLASCPMLLFAFRTELGPKRFLQYMIGGIASVLIASATLAAFTGFGNMFRRLESVTQTEGGIPMTRAGTWPIAIEKIKRDPWFGEGPYYAGQELAKNTGMMPAQFEDLSEVVTIFDPYPHSLYLYLLRTVGILGLIAMLWFFAAVMLELRRAIRRPEVDAYSRAILKGGTIMIGAFLVTQITLEFNRPATMDYAHYVLAVMGLLVGIGDRPPSASGPATEAISARGELAVTASPP
jgi:O-antigen ligase